MNKILIVGHPQSGYQEVESLLNECGMSRALPSRREGFTPEEIAATLCKAHKARPLHQLEAGQAIDQLEPSPVWHGMALDLMLGNIDQELWGWADPTSAYLLDYWKAMDEKIAFILVYGSPETMLATSERSEYLNEEELQQRAHVWQAYNAALLHFYYRNMDRCLLVHTEQVRLSASKYLQQVRARIGAPLGELKALPTAASTEQITQGVIPQHAERTELRFETKRAKSSRRSRKAQQLALKHRNETTVASITEVQTQTDIVQLTASSLPADDIALERYLAQAIVGQQPQILQLYAELQSAANLPLADETATGIHALHAWRGLTAMQVRTQELTAHLQQAKAEAQQKLQQADEEKQALNLQVETAHISLRSAQEELDRHNREIERLTQETAAKAEQLAQQLASQSKLAETSKEQQKENELILLQLHQVQEELERFYLEAQQQKAKIDALKEVEKLAAERAHSLEQLRQEKAKLASEKESLNKLATDRSAQAEELKKKLAEQAKLAESLASEKTKLSKLAAERATQAEDLTKKLAEESKRAQAEAQEIRKLAEKQANTSEIQQENDLLLLQLHQVQEELERYYLQNQRLQKNTAPSALLTPTGAAERVKRHLAYRLGSVMLQNHRSLPGWMRMPWALAREARQFRKENLDEQERKLPPLHQYQDAREGQAIKEHLTYRLGTALVAHSGSPLGWIKLPFALRREIKAFKQKKKPKAA